MHRQPLLSLLDSHIPSDAHETQMRERLRSFVAMNPDCFERSLTCGHITGSAWIIDEARTHALLTHHAKLGCWLQLGGHADGDADVLRVALREAREESGLDAIFPLSPAIFDLDIHTIPARGQEPQHFHYDVRFLFQANRAEPLIRNAESKELAWVELAGIAALNPDESLRRMVLKTQSLYSSI